MDLLFTIKLQNINLLDQLIDDRLVSNSTQVIINLLLMFLKCSSATTNPLLQTVFCIANHAKLVQNRQKRRGWELIFWWRHTKINVETRAPYSHDTSREPARVGISDTIMQASSTFYFTVSYITQLSFIILYFVTIILYFIQYYNVISGNWININMLLKLSAENI